MKRLIKAMDDAVDRAGLAKEDIAAIGIGVPGIIDGPRGVIIRITNIPGMENVEIARMLREWRPVPVVLSNDVRVAATGELRMGAGRGLRSMVTIFVGTGIGGGLILDGKIYEGTRGSAGEVGDMVTMADGPYAPGGGIRGGIEAIASRTAIERDLRAGIAAGRRPSCRSGVGRKERRADLQCPVGGGRSRRCADRRGPAAGRPITACTRPA